jgi:hypothetical protein
MLRRFSGRTLGWLLATTVLLVVAVTGTAVATATITTADIVNGAVTNPKLANNAVSNTKIANGAVTGAKIAANSVTGAQIDESTLAKVPNANKLDGLDSTAFAGGPGRIISNGFAISRSSTGNAYPGDQASAIGYNISFDCPVTPGTGDLKFINTSGSSLDLWYSVDGGSSIHKFVNDSNTVTLGNITDDLHDVTIDMDGVQSFKLGTIHWFVKSDTNYCTAYAMSVLNY